MDFNKLFSLLSVQLAGYGAQFKEIKRRTEATLQLQNLNLNRLQLPSDFFKVLVEYGKVSQKNLLPLYEIYAGSNLPANEKFKAFKYIQEFNHYQLSYMATEILQQVILALVKHPVDTNEIRALVEYIPEGGKTPQMSIDHSASLMKLIKMRTIHAFDFRVLQLVFMNNSNVTRNIIDPAWRKIIELHVNYTHNQRQIQPDRPANIRVNPIPIEPMDPSPVESFYPMEHQQTHQHPQSEIPHYAHHSPILAPIVPHTNPTYFSPPTANDDSILNEMHYDVPELDVLEGVYPGECLIINIEKFQESSGISDRIGSEIDVENIKRTFEQLKFKVTVKKDLTSENLMKYLKEKSTDDALKKIGVFVCFLMSHGEEGRISCADGNHIEIDTIITNFKNDQCYALQGKPKIFFVQACRGNMIDNPGQPVRRTHYSDDIPRPQPQDADIMICHATTKGKVAVRTDEGSWYITTLCDIILRGYPKLDLLKIHTRVNNEVSKLSMQGGSTLQVSNSSGSLRKTVNFFPNMDSRRFLQEVYSRK